MAKSPPSPELVQAYQLIKQGQRQQAGQIIKAVLKTDPQNTDAWWLMAHAVTKPELVRRALETVLKYDPNHQKARAMLAKLDAAPPPPPPPPPAAQDLSALGLSAEPSAVPRRASTPAPAQAVPSFEEFERASTPDDPFAGPAAIEDPFANVPTAASPLGAAPAAKPITGSYDPFASANVFDPTAAAHLRSERSTTQAAGTGGQPDWGPGLAFVRENEPPAVAAKLDFSARTNADYEAAVKPSYESLIGWVLAAVAIVVLIGLIAYFALNRGDKTEVGPMQTLDADHFTMSIPKGYDVQCGSERSGYQVCGIANHAYYNDLNSYLGTNVDIASMMSQALSMAFAGGGNIPNESVSIVVMDVPENSPAYDPGSWAKTKYEWTTGDYSFFVYDDVVYNKQNDPPRKVNGYDGYYYEFIARDNQWGRDIAYDIYIPHDGLMLWMTVSIVGPERGSDYRDMVQAMSDSIQIKPRDQWIR